MSATIYLTKGGHHRILRGHPWVFKSEVDSVDARPRNGESVRLCDSEKRFIGSGIYNDQSQIVFRRYSTEDEPLDRKFLQRKIREAIAYRNRLDADFPERGGRIVTASSDPKNAGPSGEPGKNMCNRARRLVWSESDSLPGLIVDQYGSCCVLQTVTLAMSLLQSAIVEILCEELQPEAIIARNDVLVRKFEGLQQMRGVLYGKYNPPVMIEVAGVKFPIDLMMGQKTGFYLDQVDNYATVARYAKGRRVLDCFTYQGGFALTALRAGALSCRAVDQSADALAAAQNAANANDLKLEGVKGNVFDVLRTYERSRESFDMIVLDPPSFTKSKEQVDSAMRGYNDIHLRALRLLPRGGLLATFCCSHNVRESDWHDMVVGAAADAGASLRLLEHMVQSRDHPVLPAVPETSYLVGYLLEKL